ncbi:MAG: hypothetical protein H0X50_10745 [Nitrosopumilus sp.]|nr:hypothetical protein [Nitrosopumilus sp.]
MTKLRDNIFFMFSLKEIGTIIKRCMGKEENKTEYSKIQIQYPLFSQNG